MPLERTTRNSGISENPFDLAARKLPAIQVVFIQAQVVRKAILHALAPLAPFAYDPLRPPPPHTFGVLLRSAVAHNARSRAIWGGRITGEHTCEPSGRTCSAAHIPIAPRRMLVARSTRFQANNTSTPITFGERLFADGARFLRSYATSKPATRT